MKLKEQDQQEQNDQGIVLYTDGGCRPTSRGYTGWGVHGYLFENVVPKKGSGNHDVYLTNAGYVKKKEVAKDKVVEVKPLLYFDAYGSSVIEGTNNTAEIDATTNAFKKAKEYSVKTVNILTDSQYVQKGVTEWASTWVKRNWVKINGDPVPNSKEWKELLGEYNELINRGVSVKVDWIKGHDGHLGNEKADQLATVGVFGSMRKLDKIEFKSSGAEGYWKADVERHPFIGNRRMYFNTLSESNVPGEYYLGEHGKDDDHIGKKTSDGALCVVQLKTPDYVLEDIRNYMCEISAGVDTIAMVRLDEVYKPETYKSLSNYGASATKKVNTWSCDLETFQGEPLVKQLIPPMIAMRAIDSVKELKALLEEYKKDPVAADALDITDILYSRVTVEKKNKEPVTEVKLKPEYAVGFNSLPIDFESKNKSGQMVKLKIILTLGIDILNRNYLKRLEDFDPKVKIVVWQYAEGVYKYATIIESQGNFGIWVGAYSNTVFVKSPTAS